MKPVIRQTLSMLLTLLAVALLVRFAAPAVDAAPHTPVTEPFSLATYGGWIEKGEESASGGGISNTEGSSREPSLAIAPDETPVVAWSEVTSDNLEIYLKRWQDPDWIEMGASSAAGGGISNSSGDSTWPSIAVSADEMFVVAWTDDSSGNSEIYVRRWDGFDWAEIGEHSASEGGISENKGVSELPRIAFTLNDGQPLVTWADDSSGNFEIYVLQWVPLIERWVELGPGSATGGGISNNAGNSHNPVPLVAPDGTVIIVWYDDSSGNAEIYVRRFDGLFWNQMGDGSATGGGISRNGGVSRYPVPAVAPDGTPYIAWTDDSDGNYEIYVRRWDGSAWSEIGDSSATGGGISSSNGNSENPSLAVSVEGIPIIAWHEDLGGGNSEIYVRRWDDPQWVEFGSGSASDGGISQSVSNSSVPSLGIIRGGPAIVAWKDRSSGNYEIYVRQSPSILACHLLLISHTGQGEDPVATPPNSDGCPVGDYVAGQPIVLTAQPDTGWEVESWSGTSDDESNDLTNQLAMPEGDHAVSVVYVQSPITDYRSFIPQLVFEPCFAGPDEQEPNDSPEESDANYSLCAPGFYSGLPNDEFDIFSIDTAGGAYKMELTNYYGGQDAQLLLRDEEGGKIAHDGDPKDGLVIPTSTDPLELAEGHYYFIIYNAKPSPGVVTKYNLVIEYEAVTD